MQSNELYHGDLAYLQMNALIDEKARQDVTECKRIFIVGCPRSGTTILQKGLVDRYRLYSLPETRFFEVAAGQGLGAVVCRYGVAFSSARTSRAFRFLRQSMGSLSLPDGINLKTRRFREIVGAFVNVLDHEALVAGETAWLEKTPKHFPHVHLIRRFVPGAKVIHMVRWGPDVVASLRDLVLTFSPRFDRYADYRRTVKLWNRAVEVAHRDAKKKRAYVVLYEDFAKQPEVLLHVLGTRLGLEDRQVFGGSEQHRIYQEKETWKQGVNSDIRRRPSKFNDVFGSIERDRVLAGLNLSMYRDLVNWAIRPNKSKG